MSVIIEKEKDSWEQILDLRRIITESQFKIEELKKTAKENRLKYLHECQHCGAKWYGFKEIIKECTECKGRLNMVKKGEKVIDGNKVSEEDCAKLDEHIRRYRRADWQRVIDGKKMQTVFTWDGKEMRCLEKETEKEDVLRIVMGSYEIFKDSYTQNVLRKFGVSDGEVERK